MKEVLFIIENLQEGGFMAHSVDHSIVTQGETLPELRTMIDDALRCHFEESKILIRLISLS